MTGGGDGPTMTSNAPFSNWTALPPTVESRPGSGSGSLWGRDPDPNMNLRSPATSSPRSTPFSAVAAISGYGLEAEGFEEYYPGTSHRPVPKSGSRPGSSGAVAATHLHDDAEEDRGDREGATGRWDDKRRDWEETKMAAEEARHTAAASSRAPPSREASFSHMMPAEAPKPSSFHPSDGPHHESVHVSSEHSGPRHLPVLAEDQNAVFRFPLDKAGPEDREEDAYSDRGGSHIDEDDGMADGGDRTTGEEGGGDVHYGHHGQYDVVPSTAFSMDEDFHAASADYLESEASDTDGVSDLPTAAAGRRQPVEAAQQVRLVIGEPLPPPLLEGAMCVKK